MAAASTSLNSFALILSLALATMAQSLIKEENGDYHHQHCPSNSSLTVVHSLYHRADHCICPDGYACTGSACSIGHGTDGYSYTVSGFKSDCVDCRCVWAPRSEGLPRDKGALWIIGTHHKMRSEFMRDLWKATAQVVTPPLSFKLSCIWPLRMEAWAKIEKSIDIFVNCHAQDIQPSLRTIIGRPYRFVHIYRDPVEALVSAYLYETQRYDSKDRYNVLYRKFNDSEVAFNEVIDHTMIHAIRPMVAQYRMAEADPNSLNIRFEDFDDNYNMTLRRMFFFLGVPAALEQKFIDRGVEFDINRPGFDLSSEPLKKQEHITTGKYDKGPLLERVANGPYKDELAQIRRELYGGGGK